MLLDADGVIQEVPGGWNAAMEPFLGERAQEFLRRVWRDEPPMLAGKDDYFALLEKLLPEYGVV
ncbi:hypothetical protein [Agromyces archimandritae]|uniref:Uncharacterized protein n=1 Tax=Agromyces archimandritae TaxID=2781962 RepID=A0A975FMM2_9MICO|nr:hypothetical protein [Agromyces archimandritae]QTX04288.1 hypothetical protein G127AT_13545 [Agromyces archimandritae]